MTRYLALDVGGRRIGVAISDGLGTIASPLTVIRRRSKVEDYDRIVSLAREHEVGTLVVGHPLDREGRPGPQARRIEHYTAGLVEALAAEGLDVRVEFWDESLSTRRAHEVLMASGRKRAYRQAREDAVAAAVVLQDYLASDWVGGSGQSPQAGARESASADFPGGTTSMGEEEL